MSESPAIYFRNVDLALSAPVPLNPLLAEFEASGHAWGYLHEYDDHWHLTINTDSESGEAETHIVELLDMIERLSGDAESCWEACSRREFNAGYDSGYSPRSFEHHLSTETLRRLADCGATFALTIYPVTHPDRQ